jgi:hypothetical protein
VIASATFRKGFMEKQKLRTADDEVHPYRESHKLPVPAKPDSVVVPETDTIIPAPDAEGDA